LTLGVALGALLLAVGACDKATHRPTEVIVPVPPAAAPGPGPGPGAQNPGAGFQPVSGPARIYNRVSPDHTNSDSRFVLYDNGTFSLQYVSQRFGAFQYLGRYSRTESAVAFSFDGWSIAGPWLAQGTFSGDRLTVVYNLIMQMSDFADRVYVSP